MPRKKVHRILLLIPLLLAGGLAWGWWYMAAGRFPLAGDLHHDFGTVAIVGPTSSFSHTFQLRNRRSEPVIIETIRSGCGCTKAEASTMTVAPGASVDVDITLSLARAGKKRTSVNLMIADFGPQSLWIQAVGRKETALSTSASTVLLTSDTPAQLTVMAEIQSNDDEPPAPSVDTPDGVRASFRGWKAVAARDPEKASAARWRGIFDVELTEGAQTPGSGTAASELTISLGAAPPVRVRVVGRAEDPG